MHQVTLLRFVAKVLCIAGLLTFASSWGVQAESSALPTYMRDRAVYQLSATFVDDAITVTTRLEFPDADGQALVDTFWLVGFAGDEHGPPVDLGIRWRKDGWFQQWTLGLDTNLGIIPTSLRPSSGTGTWSGYQMITLEGSKFPEPGHVYETTASYAPKMGYLAISVMDLTTQQQFYRGVLQLAPLAATVYAGSGYQLVATAEQPVVPSVPSITNVVPELVPVGVRWRLLERQDPGGSALPVTRIDRSNELLLEVDTGGDVLLPGELRFFAQSGHESIPLGTIDTISGVTRLSIDSQLLPAGDIDLVMEHFRQGEVAFAEERSLDVGLVRVTLDPLVTDEQASTLRGALVITADGPVEQVAAELEVSAEARAIFGSTAVEWNDSFSSSFAVGLDPVRIPFEFPTSDDPYKWTVRAIPKLTAPDGVRVRVEVPDRLTLITGTEDASARVLRLVREQYLEEFLLSGTISPNVPPIRTDGSWADVDYADQSVGGWKSVSHLDRVLQMARAYAMETSALSGDTELRDAIISALRYWTQNRFRNPNWWFNTIWQPQRLGDILLLMGDETPTDVYEGAIELIQHELAQTASGAYTGANLVWNEGNRLRLGLVLQDLEMVAYAYEAMVSELRVMSAGKEGIQVDGSFHQHGVQLYSGGYGESFAGELARYAHVARGTSLISQEALLVLVNYILDGQQWMVRGLTFDFSTTGRTLTRQMTSGNASYLIGLLQTLVTLPDVPRKLELEAFLDRLLGNGVQMSGNKYFWTSDFMTHHRPDYYVSLRASTNRTMATEIGNYENLKGHHLGDGVMFIMRSGKEYDQAFPVWDWEQLPGTTVRHMEHQRLVDGSWLTVRGAGDPGSGVSDGEYGALAFNVQRDGVAARKAWFFFDREIVALGTDIKVPLGAKVTTSVNQTRLAGDVLIGSGPEVTELEPNQKRELSDPGWVFHDDVVYVFPTPTGLTISNAPQTGSWSDINTAYSSQPLSIPIFSLWFDHSNSSTPAEYAYIVAPGIDRENALDYVQQHGVTVLANDRNVQAVWNAGLQQLQAVFWDAGTIVTPSGLSVTAHAPALVLVKERDGQFEVTGGTLDRRPGTLSITLAQRSGEAEYVGEAHLTFPTGDYLGASVSQTVSPKQ